MSGALLVVGALASGPSSALGQGLPCGRIITADVVALDQPFFWNRLGAVNPGGMIFALRRDVRPIDESGGLSAGNVQLVEQKRPRPLVLRMNVGDCLQIQFQNLLNSAPVDANQPSTRRASIHVIGLQPVTGSGDDGSHVGQNDSSLVAPGESAVYTLYAEREGQHLLHSAAATTGGEGDGGQLNAGLFGAVNVEPAGSRWYRSQVTARDLALAQIGTTAAGQPILDYEAVYPPGHPRAALPILNLLAGREIVHADLTAIIAGPKEGRFLPGSFPPVRVLPDRDQPFRELTIIYHDEIIAVQAFEEFEDAELSHALQSVRDGFAINYGSAGLGAEILANRLGVGPMRDCTECKYEEFFLSSWTVGDPAMVVDVPANAGIQAGRAATQAMFPDDPSNVYHSYLRDHVKFRILHGGSKEHHIHHQHAHQWLFAPDSDNSTYLDSQSLGPGASFTLEMTYHGSGNRNQTAGDSIFHCHFYPHFAQGMWALWRVHDVFEAGTALDSQGRPAPGSRALPDGEIAAGTPIPALVPLPGLAMAFMPQAQVEIVDGQVQVSGRGNPGFPFFVPGIAGHRAPHPPLDTIEDGGLPRHVITGGASSHVETRLDFTKTLQQVTAVALKEEGEPVERAAMRFHGQRSHPSFTPEGKAAPFVANGLPAVPGAPFADPCIDDDGRAAGTLRRYQAAAFQMDATFNKDGWHFPQQRLFSLWGDVASTLSGERPPEPLFMRAHSNDCIEFQLVNLVPNIYELDDFQVRTPTDLLGQHIHLVKFDVMASDGSANGFNYEDGSFSPDEVRERIAAIRAENRCQGKLVGDPRDGSFTCPLAKAHPFFGPGPDQNGDGTPDWLGAQATVQRWFADDVLNQQGEDRTLRTVFTHDHFSPSTHQQAGLYAGVLVEPAGSTWRHPETGEILGHRFDGGPVSSRADILTANPSDSYREFVLEFADFQPAYLPNQKTPAPYAGPRQPGQGFDDPARAINPPACPPGVSPPCPEAVAADDTGTMVVNYRNEPVALRVRDPRKNAQAEGDAGDLAMVFRSDIDRADPAFNRQPRFYPPLSGGVKAGDPFTPLLRVYDGDPVQVRILVGAHEEGHNFSIHGLKWFFEPSDPNSGWRNSQFMGISEQFNFETPVRSTTIPDHPITDHLYKAGSSVEDLWNGLWGLLRAYHDEQDDLLALPNNRLQDRDGDRDEDRDEKQRPGEINPGEGACPTAAPMRTFDVTAVLARDALPGGTLVYNRRGSGGRALHDPTAMLLVRSDDLDARGKVRPDVPIEPLILRARAGECIRVVLTNQIPAVVPDLAGSSTLPRIVGQFDANQLRPSSHVGLHTQLLAYDVASDDGQNVGFNPVQTVPPSSDDSDEDDGDDAPSPSRRRVYTWYAGDLAMTPQGRVKATPIEFGAVNLIPADPIKQTAKGLVGALLIEPEGASWQEDSGTRAQATVTLPWGETFREFVVILQDDLNLRLASGEPVPNLAGVEDSEDTGQKAVNYRTEPMWLRMGFAPQTPLDRTRTFDFSQVLANQQVGGDPETPVFVARAGTPVRFRLLDPGGHQRNHVFQIHGHIWDQEPHVNGSQHLGSNPKSSGEGAHGGVGPADHFNILLDSAGGRFSVPGDYLYRDMTSHLFNGGLWGIFRVTPWE